MAGIGHFNADEVDTTSDFDPVPPGTYVMQIVNSDVKPTKDGKGKYIWLEHEILEGPYKGRKVWNNLNLWNANPQAVKIAEKQFAKLCKACAKHAVEDTAELHGYPFRAIVEQETNDRGTQNRLKDYLFEDTATATKQATSTAAVQAATSGEVPWGRG